MSAGIGIRVVVPPPEKVRDQDPEEIVEIAEHPRMKAEREQVKNMSEITDFRPKDRAPVRFRLEDMTTGMVGRSKHVRDVSIIGRSVGGTSTRGVFGQDAAFCNVIRDEERSMTTVLGIIADGHGMMGEDVSRKCVDDLREGLLMPMRLRVLLDLLVAENSDAVREEIRSCFLAIDHAVCDDVALGGSTLTVWMVLQDHHTGRVFVVTSNVGDSPLLLIRTSCGKVGEMTTRHSWDSIPERRAHNRACLEAGRPVPEVIYARWNTEGRQTIVDTQGRFYPLRMFKGSTDEIDEENRDHIVTTIRAMGKRPGGIQSRVRKLQKIRRQGSTVWEDDVLPGTGHENYGSTPLEYDAVTGMTDGGPQMTRSIGDRRYKHYTHSHSDNDHTPFMRATPSVSILECWGGSVHFAVVGFSDGPGDALYSSEFGEETRAYFDKNKGTGTATAQGLADHLLEAVKREGSFFFGTSRWDDLSMVCSTFMVAPQEEG